VSVAAEAFLQSCDNLLARQARFEKVERERNGRRAVVHGFLPVEVCVPAKTL